MNHGGQQGNDASGTPQADVVEALRKYNRGQPIMDAELRAAMNLASGPGADGDVSLTGSRPSRALLKFHEGLLIFCSAVLSAIFIGMPHVVYSPGNGAAKRVRGLPLDQLYLHAAQWLVAAIALTAALALATQLAQVRLDSKGFDRTNTWLWGIGVLTGAAVVLGAYAGYPLLLGFPE